MASVLQRSSEAGKATDLQRELIAAGFVIEAWGDGAKLVLAPHPRPLSPALRPGSAFLDQAGKLAS